MKGVRKFSAASAAVILAATLGLTGAVEAGPVRVGHSTWVGNGPLYIAQEMGYFTEEGVEFNDINIGDVKLRFAAAAAGEIDIILTTPDAAMLYLREGDEYQLVIGADTSVGGDGIVSTKDIASIEDLRGKQVAFNEGSTSHFLISTLLKEHGMTMSDIVPVNMDPGDAGGAMIAEQVDAAVTWEPWLTKARNSGNAHVLWSTADRPDFIIDYVIVRKGFIEDHPEDVAAFVRAWYKAVDFYNNNRDEAIAIAAKGTGDWLSDPAVFAETLAGVAYYDRERNHEIFGTRENPGSILPLVEATIAAWSEAGLLQTEIDPMKIINWDFVNE